MQIKFREVLESAHCSVNSRTSGCFVIGNSLTFGVSVVDGTGLFKFVSKLPRLTLVKIVKQPQMVGFR